MLQCFGWLAPVIWFGVVVTHLRLSVMSTVANSAVLFPGEGMEWLYIATTRIGCKIGRTSLALNQRWSHECHLPEFNFEGVGVDYAMRFSAVVARRVESRIKGKLHPFRARSAPVEYANEVFERSTRQVFREVLDMVDVVEAELQGEMEPAKNPPVKDGDVPWDESHPHIVKFADGGVDRL
eukprot:4447792-Amphidinium_carterae.1